MSRKFGSNYFFPQGGGTNFELLRKQCWEVTIPGLNVTLLALSCNIPQTKVDSIKVYHKNTETKAPGRPTVDDMQISFYDAIDPDLYNELKNWFEIVHNTETGEMGYGGEAKKNIIVKQLDQKGNVLRTHTCEGCFPKNDPVPSQPLDYSSQDPVMLDMTFSVDRVIRGQGSGTGGNVASGV